MSKFVISEALDAAVNARSVHNFKVNNLFVLELSIGRDFKYFRTISTSHINEYLGFGGLRLNVPDIKAITLGFCPAGKPLMGS